MGYRLIQGISIVAPRSFCLHCKQQIAWYDNIPLISYLFLKTRCRSCKERISVLYPFIELISISSFTALYYLIDPHYWIAYGVFFSALIVTIRTDLESMLISRYVTLFVIPLGFLFAYFELLPISLPESILGTIGGYLFLWSVAKFFYRFTGKEGMGQGDLELLAFIGSCIGPIGCWLTITFSSLLGSMCALLYLFFAKKSSATKIPFGPFLAISAMIYVLAQSTLISLFF